MSVGAVRGYEWREYIIFIVITAIVASIIREHQIADVWHHADVRWADHHRLPHCTVGFYHVFWEHLIPRKENVAVKFFEEFAM